MAMLAREELSGPPVGIRLYLILSESKNSSLDLADVESYILKRDTIYP